jgi:hypothetical protein
MTRPFPEGKIFRYKSIAEKDRNQVRNGATQFEMHGQVKVGQTFGEAIPLELV